MNAGLMLMPKYHHVIYAWTMVIWGRIFNYKSSQAFWIIACFRFPPTYLARVPCPRTLPRTTFRDTAAFGCFLPRFHTWLHWTLRLIVCSFHKSWTVSSAWFRARDIRLSISWSREKGTVKWWTYMVQREAVPFSHKTHRRPCLYYKTWLEVNQNDNMWRMRFHSAVRR